MDGGGSPEENRMIRFDGRVAIVTGAGAESTAGAAMRQSAAGRALTTLARLGKPAVPP